MVAFRILHNHQDAEEIAQDVIFKFSQGKGQGQSVNQAVIDAIRARFGRTRSPGGSHRPTKQSQTISLDSKKFDGYHLHELIGKFEPDTGFESNDVPDSVDTRAKNTREDVMLQAYESGIPLHRIAVAFGITPSRVSQILSPYFEEKRKETLNRKLKFAEKASRLSGEIEVEWWELT